MKKWQGSPERTTLEPLWNLYFLEYQHRTQIMKLTHRRIN